MRPAEIIAARLMISTNYYYAIEGGYAMPSDDLMYRICLLYGLPAHMIWLDLYGIESWD